MPGPASSVEEHSLRNIPSEGTVVRSSPRAFLFRRDLFANFAQMFDGSPNKSDKIFQSRNLDLGKLLRQNSTEWRGNVTLKNGPMTSSDRVTSYILYYATLTHTNLATYDNNQLLYDQPMVDRRDIDWNRPRQQRSMAHKTRAGRRIIGQ